MHDDPEGIKIISVLLLNELLKISYARFYPIVFRIEDKTIFSKGFLKGADHFLKRHFHRRLIPSFL